MEKYKKTHQSDIIAEYKVSFGTLLFNYLGVGVISLFLLLFGIALCFVSWGFIFSILLFFAPVFFICYNYLNMPYKITCLNDNHVMLKSIIGSNVVNYDEIHEIRKSWVSSYVLIIRLKKRKLKMLNRIDGLYEFLSVIKLNNPNFLTKGL